MVCRYANSSGPFFGTEQSCHDSILFDPARDVPHLWPIQCSLVNGRGSSSAISAISTNCRLRIFLATEVATNAVGLNGPCWCNVDILARSFSSSNPGVSTNESPFCLSVYVPVVTIFLPKLAKPSWRPEVWSKRGMLVLSSAAEWGTHGWVGKGGGGSAAGVSLLQMSIPLWQVLWSWIPWGYLSGQSNQDLSNHAEG